MSLISELFYFEKIREDLNNLADGKPTNVKDEFIVYVASGPNTDKVYYGYCKGDTEEAIKKAFLLHAKASPEEKRGAQYLVDENGGIDNLTFDVVAFAPDEIDAHFLRDKFRKENKGSSVTGPSPFPPKIWKASQERHAPYFSQQKEKELEAKRIAKIDAKISKFRTPHDALVAKAFDKDAIANLRSSQEARDDFSNLSAAEFAKKYPQVVKL